MQCATCEQEFQESAVKVWSGKKVCPQCFHVLVAEGVPAEQRSLHIVEARQAAQTTVCPECNAEVHVDTRKCPFCKAPVSVAARIGAGFHEAADTLFRVLFILAICGLALVVLFAIFIAMSGH